MPVIGDGVGGTQSPCDKVLAGLPAVWFLALPLTGCVFLSTLLFFSGL